MAFYSGMRNVITACVCVLVSASEESVLYEKLQGKGSLHLNHKSSHLTLVVSSYTDSCRYLRAIFGVLSNRNFYEPPLQQKSEQHKTLNLSK